MEIGMADNKRQIVQLKNRLRKLALGKNNLANNARKRQREIEKLERELWDYEASHPTLPQAKLKTWRTVTIGNKSLAQYKKDITEGKGNYTFDSLGDELVKKLTIPRNERIVKLGKMNVKELGFEVAYLGILFNAIRKLGGQHCPPEVPLALACDPTLHLDHKQPSRLYRSTTFFMKGYMLKDCGPWMFELEDGVIHQSGYTGGDFPFKSLTGYTVNKNSRTDEVIIFMIPDEIKS